MDCKMTSLFFFVFVAGNLAAAANSDLFSPRFAFKGDDKGKGGGYGYGNGGYTVSGGSYGNGGYASGGYGYGGGGGYGGSGYGGGGYYETNSELKKIEETILALAIPLALVVLVPLILLGVPLFILGAVFFIGRSNSDGNGTLPHIDVIQSVNEAMQVYSALSSDEKCRLKVACQLGYILKGSQKTEKALKFVNSFLPTSLQKYLQPLEKAASFGEEGHCERYVCQTTRLTSKFGALAHLFKSHDEMITGGNNKQQKID